MSTTKADATASAPEHSSASSAAPAAAAPIGLVQQLGNQGLQTLLRARLIQAKLSVSHPQDAYEQEADRVADQVMRMPSAMASPPAGTIQRLPEGDRDLRRFSTASDVPSVDAATENAIQSLSGRGSALPESVRSFMEPRFGADFSAVRVHTDAHAHELARSVNAQAFTVSRNVVFGAGHYAPDTESGKRLLAHELTHVVQQGSASSVVQRSPETNHGPATTTLPLPTSLDDFLKPKTGPTLTELVNGTVDISTLQPAEAKDAIEEIQQFRDRQITSSFTGARLDDILAALYRQLGKKEQEIALASGGRRAARGKGKAIAVRPERFPRVLAQKASVLYANQAEVHAEYDLIMQWLAVPDLKRKDRHLLELERENLEFILSDGRQRAGTERHTALVRAALAVKDEADVAAALMTLARTIDGIHKDPDDDRIHYLYFHGERLAISAEQAAGLRKDLTNQLQQAAQQIFAGGSAELHRFDARIKRNADHWFRASMAEIFEGHVFSSIHDPIDEVLPRYTRLAEHVQTTREHLAAGRLVEAAAALPDMERLFLEVRQRVEAYIHDYEEGEGRAIATLEITAAVVAAVAISVAAVAVAPMVAGYVGGFVGAEGLGLTGIAGTAVTAVGTAVGTGTIVGLGAAGVRGGVGFGVSLATGHSLADSWDVTKVQAVQGFWDGMLAGAGGGAGRVLAKAVGVGSGLAFQAARRAGSEAIVNGTITLADTLAHGGTLKEAVEAATRSALLSVPGSLIGSGSVKQLVAGTITAAGNGYVSAYASGVRGEQLLQQAAVASVTHVAVSRAGHGQVAEAEWTQRGQQHAKAVRSGVVKVTAAAMIGVANPLPSLPGHGGGPQIVLHDDSAASTRTVGEQPTPASTSGRAGPEPVHDEAPGALKIRFDDSPVAARGGDQTKANLGERAAPRPTERNTMDNGDGGGRRQLDSDPLAPVPRTGRKSPERLFELLEKGGSRKLNQATVEGQVDNPPASGVFRRGLTSPRAAYRAFNKALAGSAGREVGIFYNTETGEYAVIIDSAVKVGAPENESGWIGLVHFHHNEFNSWVLRLPSPKSDFSDLWARTRSENERVREFVEWNDPSGGRGRTELGIDLAWPQKPIYVRIIEPTGKQWIERFKTEADYHRYYDSHTKFVEPKSALHNWVLSGARKSSTDPDGAAGASSQRTAMDPVDGQAPRTATDLAMLDRARSSIREKLLEMLRNKTVVETFTVEQVKFGAVSIKLVKDVLHFSFFEIRKDISAPRGHGKLILQEFERAVMDVGRAVSARRVRGDLYVVNSRLAEDLTERVDRPWGGDEKTKGEGTPRRLFLEIELSGSSGRTPKGPPPAETSPARSQMAPKGPGDRSVVGGGPPRRSTPPSTPEPATRRAGAEPTAVVANRDINSSRTAGSPGNTTQIPRSDAIPLHNEAPGILYQANDGTVRLITVHNGRPHYMSLGASESSVEGVPTKKIAGEFYEFAGVQEVELIPPPPGEELPIDYDELSVGWLIKAKGLTSLEPEPELHEFTFRFDSEKALTRPEEVNAWLAAHGAKPLFDFPTQVLKWRAGSPSHDQGTVGSPRSREFTDEEPTKPGRKR